MTIVGPPFQWQ